MSPFDEMEIRAAHQLFDIVQKTCGEVIQTGHIVPLKHKVLTQVASDKSGTAGDKYFHLITIFQYY